MDYYVKCGDFIAFTYIKNDFTSIYNGKFAVLRTEWGIWGGMKLLGIFVYWLWLEWLCRPFGNERCFVLRRLRRRGLRSLMFLLRRVDKRRDKPTGATCRKTYVHVPDITNSTTQSLRENLFILSLNIRSVGRNLLILKDMIQQYCLIIYVYKSYG